MMIVILYYYDDDNKQRNFIIYYYESQLLLRYEMELIVGWVDYGRLVPEPSMGIIIFGLKIPFLCLFELLLYEATWESL